MGLSAAMEGNYAHRLTGRQSPNLGESKSFTGFPCWPTGVYAVLRCPRGPSQIDLDLSR